MILDRSRHYSEPPVVRGFCEETPVWDFGYTHIFGAPPLLKPDEYFQKGNDKPINRIKLKNSDEISCNYIGCASTRMPRISDNDYLPVEINNLIDGNVQTCWMSKTQPRSDTTPVWVRLDLPYEYECSRIILRKRPINPNRVSIEGWFGVEKGAVEVGRGLPSALSVRVSADGMNWTTVFDGETNDSIEKEFFEIQFAPQQVRMVWVEGTKLIEVENFLFCFSFANLELYDKRGENVALISKGAGITTNSTTHSFGATMDEQKTLFPVHYDMGAKWVRVGYHDDAINWHWVEQKKGEMKIDPYADAAITEMKDNGVETIFCLNYGNRLYTERPERQMPQLWEWNYEPPMPPTTDEALRGWERYCRYMVRHFKDRVKYFEVWNEWNYSGYWGVKPDVNHYLKLAHIAIQAIREEAPEAKIVMGSYAGFLWGISEWSKEEYEKRKNEDFFMIAIADLAKDVDAIGYHPFYHTSPESDNWRTYIKDIEAFDAYCRNQGFNGRYFVTEFTFCNCVPAYETTAFWSGFSCTELEKAYYVSRLITINARYGIGSLFCETFNSVFPMDLGLFRRSTVQNPIDAQQPQAAYYLMRNLCTYMDGVEGCDLKPDISGQRENVVSLGFRRAEEKIFAAWLDGIGNEKNGPVSVEVTLPADCEYAVGFDPINGTEQELELIHKGGKAIITDWALKEYPMFIRVG